MLRAEVVEYLCVNLPKFPVDVLRRRLDEDGVDVDDFEDCLREASRRLARIPQRRVMRPLKPTLMLFTGGIATMAGLIVYGFAHWAAAPPPSQPAKAAESAATGFVGARGWVVSLPSGFVAVSKDSPADDEIVHFCPAGTDPTNFIDKGLFGGLRIVRLEVVPSEFPPNADGAAALAAAAERKTRERGETYILKKLQIGTLPGVQINVQSPFPRVEAYVLGQRDVYFFYGGQDGPLWRTILFSLRDTRAEGGSL